MDGDASNRSAWREIAGAFFKLGTLSYGGPAIMGLMQTEIQERRGWLSKERFVEGLALVNMLPGAGATQLADAAERDPGPHHRGGGAGHARRVALVARESLRADGGRWRYRACARRRLMDYALLRTPNKMRRRAPALTFSAARPAPQKSPGQPSVVARSPGKRSTGPFALDRLAPRKAGEEMGGGAHFVRHS